MTVAAGGHVCAALLPIGIRDRGATDSHEPCPINPHEFGASRIVANSPQKGVPPRRVDRESLKVCAGRRVDKCSNLLSSRRVEHDDAVGVACCITVTTGYDCHLISSGEKGRTGQSAVVGGPQRKRFGERLGVSHENSYGTAVLDARWVPSGLQAISSSLLVALLVPSSPVDPDVRSVRYKLDPPAAPFGSHATLIQARPLDVGLADGEKLRGSPQRDYCCRSIGCQR